MRAGTQSGHKAAPQAALSAAHLTRARARPAPEERRMQAKSAAAAAAAQLCKEADPTVHTITRGAVCAVIYAATGHGLLGLLLWEEVGLSAEEDPWEMHSPTWPNRYVRDVMSRTY